MPRRSILSAVEKESLLTLPETQDDLIRYHTLNEIDRSLIRQRRGDANRLGFAVQLCLLRYPGNGLPVSGALPSAVVQWVAGQIRVDPSCWPNYALREETRREHMLDLRAYLGLEPFGLSHFRHIVHALAELALQADKAVVLAASALDNLRSNRR